VDAGTTRSTSRRPTACLWRLLAGNKKVFILPLVIPAPAPLTVAYAGHTWGLGRIWARLPFDQKNRWMI
jgi:hypothetical protein